MLLAPHPRHLSIGLSTHSYDPAELVSHTNSRWRRRVSPSGATVSVRVLYSPTFCEEPALAPRWEVRQTGPGAAIRVLDKGPG
jgi:hypothetical protein